LGWCPAGLDTSPASMDIHPLERAWREDAGEGGGGVQMGREEPLCPGIVRGPGPFLGGLLTSFPI
jgi:hypothetical protein